MLADVWGFFVGIMCESAMVIGKADKKAAVNFMLIMGYLK